MTQYLMAGGTGFVGRSLAGLLQTEGYNVIIAARTSSLDAGLRSWAAYEPHHSLTISGIFKAQSCDVFHPDWSAMSGSSGAGPASDVAAADPVRSPVVARLFLSVIKAEPACDIGSDEGLGFQALIEETSAYFSGAPDAGHAAEDLST
ncbi:NAD(P)-dependent dehydrogenase (short-subunit alcohol dehydrogenase family) [Neorhizobium huautlense]|uniref:NAD(P)-dependent dehydrogenase (Short-subunit alcohol dehydrogenase family) n=1 Tax=Neorhizobium huautlense TaxID=67774 RepID=A0ABT9PZC1_9HYPH|nr:hypothetical protein [Neorhizobium huautlense]MDP9839830.1 NAD(P)-dependent dehydrogenase (short-subunit alcohol dehydrogenase family) [Neorhizobium huautlense]